MTTAKWMELPEQQVAVAAVTPTQHVTDVWPEPAASEITCIDPCIHVVRLGGAMYVQDGHHRLERARRAHHWTIPARVLDLSLPQPRIP